MQYSNSSSSLDSSTKMSFCSYDVAQLFNELGDVLVQDNPINLQNVVNGNILQPAPVVVQPVSHRTRLQDGTGKSVNYKGMQ